MTFFLDVSRISTRLLRSGPTGIDRVEFAYAKALVQNGARPDVVSVLTSPLGSGAVPAAAMAAHLARIEQGWLRDRAATAAADPVRAALFAALGEPIDPNRDRPLRLQGGGGRRDLLRRARQFPLAAIAKAPGRFRQALAALAANRPAVYLHASHTQLDRPERFGWLERHDVPSAFLIHDTIPLDFPEFCSPGSAARHHRRLATVSAQASVILANSAATAASVRAYMEAQRWRVPLIETVPLGVDDWSALAALSRPFRPSVPYFVCVGTIEPRKNLLFLFNVWRALVERHGEQALRLVVVGRRGWENEAMLDVLERSRALAPFLVEVSDLSDGGLAALMKGAQALLAPSQAEGFSLPVVEALALGVRVIASDVPVHREVAGGHAAFVSPIDGNGWLAALEAHARAAPPPSFQPPFRAPTWERHVAATLEILDRVAAQRGR